MVHDCSGYVLLVQPTMEEAKDQLLLQIAWRFEAEYINVQSVLGGGDDISGLENSWKIVKELQTLYDATSKFPVWPFNVSNITRFSTSYLSPIVLAVLIDLLGKIVTP